MAVRSVETDQRRGGGGAEEGWRKMSGVKQEAGSEERGWMDGRVEGLQQWVAEQHESDCGPQLGQSWCSLLITTRIRPRLLTGLDSALLLQTSSPFFTFSFLLALQQK